MPARTPFFKSFGPLLFGRSPRKTLQQIGWLDSLSELCSLFGQVVGADLLVSPAAGAHSRHRQYSQQVTFWAFAAQILSPGSPCREIVRRVEAWWEESGAAGAAPGPSTSAYCQARAKLDLRTLGLIRQHICHSLERNVLREERWLGGRPLKIVDGTCLSMPDTRPIRPCGPSRPTKPPAAAFRR